MAGIAHNKVSGKSDGADSSLIQPSDWNADHAITGDVAFAGFKATGLGTPSASGDAATKGYVDGYAAPVGHVGAGGTAHAAATTSVAGFMSAADKTKLDGVAAGATANTGTVTSVSGSGGTTGMTLSGGPITTSGTLTLGGTLAVASGGTGATDAATARTNLGLGTIATQAATSVSITGGSITGITDLAIADGGTGASTAANARTNLGLGTAATMTGPTGTIVGTTDTQTLTSKTIEAGTFTNGYTEETVTANTGTAYTIDLANGSVQILTLTGNCTFTFPTTTAGRSFLLILRQDATGSRTVTWGSSVRWPGGTSPTLSSTATRTDLFAFTSDGGVWLGRAIGQTYA